jgi:hypothetical protein
MMALDLQKNKTKEVANCIYLSPQDTQSTCGTVPSLNGQVKGGCQWIWLRSLSQPISFANWKKKVRLNSMKSQARRWRNCLTCDQQVIQLSLHNFHSNNTVEFFFYQGITSFYPHPPFPELVQMLLSACISLLD